MWWAIIILGIFWIALGVKVLSLSCDFDEIKSERFRGLEDVCERYMESALRKHDCFSDYGGISEVREIVRQREELCRFQSNLEKQLRLNANFCDFKNRDVTIKEALGMLFKHLRLEIKPGDDIKIVKYK